MLNKNEMRARLHKDYGYNFPAKAKYKRSKNRIYFLGDFQDGEEIDFFWACDKPNACAKGYAFYMGKDATSNLIHISEIESIDQTEFLLKGEI